MEYQFRQATPEDRARILEIYDHIFDAEEAGPVVCGWRRGYYPTPDVADAGIESGEMVVLTEDGYVVGSARFNKVQDDIFSLVRWEHEVLEEEVFVLHTLTVDPLCKGRGLGLKFLVYYEELARAMGCTELRMDTGGRNDRARKIYARAGFREVDERRFGRTGDGEEVEVSPAETEPGKPGSGEGTYKVIFLEKYLGE